MFQIHMLLASFLSFLTDLLFSLYLQEGAFFALLLRAMKNDINLKRIAAFSKRLLQVCNLMSFLCFYFRCLECTKFCAFHAKVSALGITEKTVYFKPNFLKFLF